MSFLELFKNPLYMSMLIYIFVVILILYTKPKIFFDKNGKMKNTGCGDGHVIFSLPMCIVIISIFIYFIIKSLNYHSK